MEWHGWQIKDSLGEDVTVGVCEFPDRKQPCLYIEKGVNIEPLAYFKTKGKAEKFLLLLDIIARSKEVS